MYCMMVRGCGYIVLPFKQWYMNPWQCNQISRVETSAIQSEFFVQQIVWLRQETLFTWCVTMTTVSRSHNWSTKVAFSLQLHLLAMQQPFCRLDSKEVGMTSSGPPFLPRISTLDISPNDKLVVSNSPINTLLDHESLHQWSKTDAHRSRPMHSHIAL